MQWTSAVLLFGLWASGLFASCAFGGFTQVLAVAMVLLLLVGIIQGPSAAGWSERTHGELQWERRIG